MHENHFYRVANQHTSNRSTTGIALLIAISIICGVSHAQSDPVELTDPSGVQENVTDISLSNRIRTFPIDIHRRVRTITVGGNSVTHTTAGTSEKLVYSNTLGQLAAQVPGQQVIADDLSLMAPNGCSLSRYTFQVMGRADPKDIGGDYQVEFGLYDGCPGAGGTALHTFEVVSIPASMENDIITIEYIRPQDANIQLYSNMWLGVKFNRQNVGIVLGAPALVGFSEDILDFPGFACNANIGGFPNFGYSSFNAEVYVTDTCPDAFPGYRNVADNRGQLNPGTQVWMADDIELGVDSCEMMGYEVAIRSVGFYTFEMRYDDNGKPGDVIPETRKIIVHSESGFHLGRFSFDEPITIPSNVWMTVRVGNTVGGWVLTGRQAALGRTRNSYYVLDSDTQLWERKAAPIGQFAGFHVSITCAGQPPLGACCDLIFLDDNNDGVCRDLPQMNCTYPTLDSGLLPVWEQGEACDADPFALPCGVAACCTPDDFCENLTYNDCAAISDPDGPVLWQRGYYCHEGEQKCPSYACENSFEDCAVAHHSAGCYIDNHNCCNRVCDEDRWCCQVTWDTICVREVQSICRETPSRGRCTNPILITPNTSNVFSVDSNTSGMGFSCHSSEPGRRGRLSTWLSFEAIDTTALISTCNTRPPVDDTLLGLYYTDNVNGPDSHCDDFVEIGCSDDEMSCGNGLLAQLCVDNLVIGQTYYIQLATKEAVEGVYQLELESPCPVLSSADQDNVSFGVIAEVVNERNLDRELNLSKVLQLEAKPISNRVATTIQNDYREVLDDPYMPRSYTRPSTASAKPNNVVRDGFVSVQVNVDANGLNIVGDAANQPSIAIDPTDPNKIVIGWRQFDTIESNFRQAGWAYSHDSGQTWALPEVLEPGVFHSNPVLAADADGNIFYSGVNIVNDNWICEVFKSTDGGVTWLDPVSIKCWDKHWMAIDRTEGIGRNNIYAFWRDAFVRSTDGGATFPEHTHLPDSYFGVYGTITVDVNGFVYTAVGNSVYKSENAQDPNQLPVFEEVGRLNLHTAISTDSSDELNDAIAGHKSPNPGGILGQTWIDSDHSMTNTRGNLYKLSSGDDVHFTRSTNQGLSWSDSIRINDTPSDDDSWQWFGTMSVAPNGRIDVFWNDTRNTGQVNLSELYYSFSWDGGMTWSVNVPVSPVWDSWVGWPNQSKIGDYYHSISDNKGVNLAYAATFNGEQDIYFLRTEFAYDCNQNGVFDLEEVENQSVRDCNHNQMPDSCEPDFDHDGTIDVCDTDIDGDGVPNEFDLCKYSPYLSPVMEDGRPVGDTNANCELDLDDYWRFQNCMTGGRLGVRRPRQACTEMFDLNDDIKFGLRDFAAFQNNFGKPESPSIRPVIDKY